MNIQGNRVIWENGDIAVADGKYEYLVHKKYVSKFDEWTSMVDYTTLATFKDAESAIEYAKEVLE